MGWPEMAEKHKNPTTQVGGRRSHCGPDPGASDSGWPENLTGVVVLLLLGQRVYSDGGQNRLPRLKPDRPKNGSKRPSSRFLGFLDFLLGFGVGSSLGTQN